MTTQVFVARTSNSIEVVVEMTGHCRKTSTFKDVGALIVRIEDLFSLAAECRKDNSKDKDAEIFKEEALAMIQAFEQLTSSKRS